ncbi:MAG: 50S ribosomal protein L32 [Candidatus Nealsonbacteria bacterium]|nr:50S ribosomal protein L32 [Candidatus Nealsonbacteria bacterium]
MAVPKKRHTKSRRDKRRMHIFLTKPGLGTCQKCGKETMPHRICANCGYYKGREVIDVLKKLDRKEKKLKKKEIQDGKKVKKDLSMEELSKK